MRLAAVGGRPCPDGRWMRKAGGVCQVPLYRKLSDEVGKWRGDIRKAALPDESLVDHVHIYDLVGGPQR